jgi:hypothetical protein
MNSESERPIINKGSFVVGPRDHDQLVLAVDALVLKLVVGVNARQASQRHQPRHEAEILVRLASRAVTSWYT